MSRSKSIWYQLGHAYEQARLRASSDGGRVAGLAERRGGPRKRDEERREVAWPTADELFSAGALLVLDRVVAGGRVRRPGVIGLLRAGAAGAAAALLTDLVRPLLHGDPEIPLIDEHTTDRLLTGIAQGLVYGALVEPRVPGPALVKGALYGSVEYAADPIGGLASIFGPHTPQGRIPVIGEFLETLDPHDRAFFEHLVFGIALALLYESSPSSNGILDDEGA